MDPPATAANLFFVIVWPAVIVVNTRFVIGSIRYAVQKAREPPEVKSSSHDREYLLQLRCIIGQQAFGIQQGSRNPGRRPGHCPRELPLGDLRISIETARLAGRESLNSRRIRSREGTATMIKTVNLRKEYGRVVAVRDLSLTVNPGDIFGLIGPNGAGKSTTISMLATILDPTEGRVYVDGLDIEENRRQVREVVGYMPDFFGLYDDLTVREYLEFFATAYRVTGPLRAGRINDALEIIELQEKRDALIGKLSRGMRQRLCLGKTLLHDPKILLLDEPASGMDPKGRVEMRNLLKRLQKQGKTVLISSHILTELSDICNAIAIIEKGGVVEMGTVDEIRAKIRGLMGLTVEVLEGISRAEKILQSDDRVEDVKVDGNRLSVAVNADAEYAAAILERLIADGVRISSFTREEANVEDIYMQICGHQVS